MLNCRNFVGVLLAGLVLGLLPMQAHAEQFVLICVPGGPGSTEEAQERIDLFLTELAKGTGEVLSGGTQTQNPTATSGSGKKASFCSVCPQRAGIEEKH